MSDLSESIFKLWSLAESKVKPADAPELWPHNVKHDPQIAWMSLHIDEESRPYGLMMRAPDAVFIDAALWRCVQLVAWDRRRRRPVSGAGEYALMNWTHVGEATVWHATAVDWIMEATAIVQRWEAKA